MNAPVAQDLPTGSASACDTCPSRAGRFRRLGVRIERWDFVVALAGNPNTGKTTVFNALTGLRMHTGNWPGKTIARAEGGFVFDDARFKLVDLPGTYSLLSASPDEEVARNFILFGQPDVTVIVVDATSLERNLNLALQIVQLTRSAVLCLNLMDEARAHRLEIDVRNLSRDLGIPVIPCAARRGEGIPELLRAIADVSARKLVPQPYRLRLDIPGLRGALDRVVAGLRSLHPGLPHAEWVALRLLEGDPQVVDLVRSGEIGRVLAHDEPPAVSSTPTTTPTPTQPRTPTIAASATPPS